MMTKKWEKRWEERSGNTAKKGAIESEKETNFINKSLTNLKNS